MLLEYIDEAMRMASYEILEDDHSYYGEIPGFQGVYANAKDLETCHKELREVLEEWLLIRLRKNLTIPALKDHNLELRKVA